MLAEVNNFRKEHSDLLAALSDIQISINSKKYVDVTSALRRKEEALS